MDKKTKKGAIVLGVILALAAGFITFDFLDLSINHNWVINDNFQKLFEKQKNPLPPLPDGFVMAEQNKITGRSKMTKCNKITGHNKVARQNKTTGRNKITEYDKITECNKITVRNKKAPLNTLNNLNSLASLANLASLDSLNNLTNLKGGLCAKSAICVGL